MELTPNLARTIAFRTVRKGYDPAEVDAFRERAAAAIESAQNQATAMEARARAAVSKLHEFTQSAEHRAATETPAVPVAATRAPAAAAPSTDVRATDDDAKTISQTLLLAQRTAEHTVSQAKADAETLLLDAKATAASEVSQARNETTKMLDEARLEARRQVEIERVSAENEVQALLARRDFLLSDVEHLEQHITAQRDRVRRAADALLDLAERSPAGLADARRPLLSASDTPTADDASPAAGTAAAEPAATGEHPVSDGTMGDEPTTVDEPLEPLEPLEPTPVGHSLELSFEDDDTDDEASWPGR